MIKLHPDKIKYLSFPDYEVMRVVFDSSEKKLDIYINGASLNNEKESGKELGIGKLSFSDWKRFEIHKFLPDLNIWSIIPNDEFEPLKDICEFELQNQSTILRGFGEKSGLWLEYKIVSPLLPMFEYES